MSLKNTLTINDLPTLKSYPVIGHTYLFMPGGKFQSLMLAICNNK